MEKRCRKIIISLSLLIILTIIGCFLLLNRVAGLPLDFKLRIFLEHFIAGFYLPAILLFFVYCYMNIASCIRSDFSHCSRMANFLWLIFFSLVILGVELYFQFFKEFNNHSLQQMIYFIFGLCSLWFYVIKIKLFNK
jgi:hypothetical protein